MKLLYLHGWHSRPGGIKPTFLRRQGYEVVNPALPDDDFDASVRAAQEAFDASRPSSRANEGFIPWGLTAGVSADPSQKPISGPVTLGPSFCVGIQIDGPGFTETFALTI